MKKKASQKTLLSLLKGVSIVLYILGVFLFIMGGKWRWFLLALCFTVSCILDYGFFRCPHCHQRLTLKMVGKDEFICTKCGKRLE